MKNLSTKIENWCDNLDRRWRRMPIKTQRLVTIIFFGLYALLSLYIMAKVCFDLGRASSELVVDHIESPRGDSSTSGKIQNNNLKDK